MKVGTICKLKVDCLGNKAGTLGVVFNDYGDGCQVIFENGSYDGFSASRNLPSQLHSQAQTEVEYFLEEVGFEESLAAYPFKNMVQVSEDYRSGVFDIAWSDGWKVFADRQSIGKILSKHEFGTEKLAEYLSQEPEFEKCEVYVEDEVKVPYLYFKRENNPDSSAIEVLSAAIDYVDFSHFEYADVGVSIFPRRKPDGDKATLFPLYVVFRKKL